MPKNAVKKSNDGRKRYRYTDKAGIRVELRQHSFESVTQFKYRCEESEKVVVSSIKMTFSELFIQWQSEYQKIFCSKSDVVNIQRAFNIFVKPEIGNMQINKIQRFHVYKIVSEAASLGFGQSEISKIRGCISRPYNWSINTLGLLLTCPTAGLITRSKQLPAMDDADDDSEIHLISNEDLTKFLHVAEMSKYYYFYLVLRYSGLRPSECAGLKLLDDHGDVLLIRRAITKYGLGGLKTKAARRDIPITPQLREVLDLIKQQLPLETKWFFSSAKGMPNLEAINSAFKRTRANTAEWKKVGRKTNGELIKPAVKFTLYHFRHTFATDAARVLRPNQLKYIMGHTSIEITLKYYIGLTDDDKTSAAESLSKIFIFEVGTKVGTNQQI
ncbi:MAG: site-specific integrase [Eubacteriales bacterium]